MLYSIKRLVSLESSKELAFTSSSLSLLSELSPEYSTPKILSKTDTLESYEYIGDDIYICEECSSTQDVIKILNTHTPLAPWTALISKRQFSGKGQYGKQWVSSDGNLFLTIMLPNIPLLMEPYSTLLLGTITVHFLRTLGVHAYSKWVNDIIVRNKKIAGILLEEENENIFFGIGINLTSHPTSQNLHKNSLLEATHLTLESSIKLSVLEIAIALRAFFQNTIQSLLLLSPEEHRKYIEDTLAYKGKYIVFNDGIISHKGIFLGISQEGALLLKGEKREEYISGSIIEVL